MSRRIRVEFVLLFMAAVLAGGLSVGSPVERVGSTSVLTADGIALVTVSMLTGETFLVDVRLSSDDGTFRLARQTSLPELARLVALSTPHASDLDRAVVAAAVRGLVDGMSASASIKDIGP